VGLRIKRLLVLGVLVGLLGPGAAAARVDRPDGTGARCKIVKKKVHGKIRKVRVCKKKKPKPAPPIAHVTATIKLEGLDYDALFSDGSLWVRVDGNGRSLGDLVERIDPSTNAVVARISVGEGYGIAAGEGAIWAPNNDTNSLSRINPASNTVTATFPLPVTGPHAVATAAGSVWVGSDGPAELPGSVTRVDPVSGAVLADIHLPGSNGTVDMATTGDAIWVVAQATIVRVDPASNKITATITAGTTAVCGGMTSAPGAVWVAGGVPQCGQGLELARIDPGSNTIVTDIRIQRQSAEDVAVGLGAVWAVTSVQPTYLARIDETKNAVTGTMTLGSRPNARMAVGAGAVWVCSSGEVIRLEPRV
jgi:DNA-binding beta-propeller fold protein YncE